MHDSYSGEDTHLPGSLLMAHPHLKDPNFVRSVVLLTAHDEDEGSLGVVINKRAGQLLGEVNPEFAKFGLENVPLYIGGPVAQDQIVLAAWNATPGSNEFHLYFGLEPLAIQSKLATEPGLQVRAFKGYSGWGKGQLFGELNDNAWIVSKMNGYAVSKLDGDNLWRHIVMDINLELGLMSLAPESIDRN